MAALVFRQLNSLFFVVKSRFCAIFVSFATFAPHSSPSPVQLRHDRLHAHAGSIEAEQGAGQRRRLHGSPRSLALPWPVSTAACGRFATAEGMPSALRLLPGDHVTPASEWTTTASNGWSETRPAPSPAGIRVLPLRRRRRSPRRTPRPAAASLESAGKDAPAVQAPGCEARTAHSHLVGTPRAPLHRTSSAPHAQVTGTGPFNAANQGGSWTPRRESAARKGR